MGKNSIVQDYLLTWWFMCSYVPLIFLCRSSQLEWLTFRFFIDTHSSPLCFTLSEKQLRRTCSLVILKRFINKKIAFEKQDLWILYHYLKTKSMSNIACPYLEFLSIFSFLETKKCKCLKVLKEKKCMWYHVIFEYCDVDFLEKITL